MLFVNLWDTVAHTTLAAYYASGAMLNGAMAAGNIVILAVSLARLDFRNSAGGIISLISTGADHASASTQATAHAVQAANSAFWLCYDTVTGIYWVYSHASNTWRKVPPPTAPLQKGELLEIELLETEEIPSTDDAIGGDYINIFSITEQLEIKDPPTDTVTTSETDETDYVHITLKKRSI